MSKYFIDLFTLIPAHETLVDEHAVQLIADGFLDKGRNCGGINAAR